MHEDEHVQLLKDEYIYQHILDPNFYLHLAIIQCLRAPYLTFKNNVKDGLIALIVAVDQLERLAKACKKIDEDKYEKKVKEYEERLKYKEKDELIRKAMLSNYKLQLLLEEIFSKLPSEIELQL